MWPEQRSRRQCGSDSKVAGQCGSDSATWSLVSAWYILAVSVGVPGRPYITTRAWCGRHHFITQRATRISLHQHRFSPPPRLVSSPLPLFTSRTLLPHRATCHTATCLPSPLLASPPCLSSRFSLWPHSVCHPPLASPLSSFSITFPARHSLASPPRLTSRFTSSPLLLESLLLFTSSLCFLCLLHSFTSPDRLPSSLHSLTLRPRFTFLLPLSPLPLTSLLFSSLLASLPYLNPFSSTLCLSPPSLPTHVSPIYLSFSLHTLACLSPTLYPVSSTL